MNSTNLAGNSFSWVLQTSWQAAVLVLLVLIVQMIFRHKLSPAWRYGLWLMVVVRLLLPVAPQTAWSIFNVAKLPLLLSRVESASFPRPFPASLVPPMPGAPEEAKPVLQSPVEASGMPASLGSVQTELVPGTARENHPRVPILDWHRVALLVWLLGSCFFATRLLCSNLRFWLRIAAEPAVTNEPARRQLDVCRSELGIRQAVKLIETEEVESPAVHGLWRKRLLLPKGIFDRFSAEQMRCIFLHELAHIKRRDLEVNWVVSVLQALHWFNPLLWFGFSRMRADREMACDALALAHLGKAPAESYGETIIKVVENLVRPPSARGLLALSEDKRQLEQRMRMIAAFRGRPGLSVLALSLFTGIAVVGLTDASRARTVASPALQSAAEPATAAHVTQLAFEASGTCNWTSWDPSGKQSRSSSYPFSMRVRERAWSMHVDNLSASYTRKGGIDSRDLVYDGADLFNVAHVPDPKAGLEAYDKLGIPKTAVPAYDTIAMTQTTDFPNDTSMLEKIIWLAYCTTDYPQLTVTNLPAVTLEMQPRNLSAVTAEYFQANSHFLKSLRASVKGALHITSPGDQSGFRFVELPPPLSEGYVALEFATESTTNIGSGLLIPRRVVASCFGPDPSAHPPRTYLVSRIEIMLASAGSAPEPITLPALPGFANILERRFSGMRFHYEETNAEWVARSAPDPVKSLEGKRAVPILRVPGSK